jgi:flagellar biosynthesis chaperone FliJ
MTLTPIFTTWRLLRLRCRWNLRKRRHQNATSRKMLGSQMQIEMLQTARTCRKSSKTKTRETTTKGSDELESKRGARTALEHPSDKRRIIVVLAAEVRDGAL